MTTLTINLPSDLAQRVQGTNILSSPQLFNFIKKMADEFEQRKEIQHNLKQDNDFTVFNSHQYVSTNDIYDLIDKEGIL